jgi:hypothetical protein
MGQQAGAPAGPSPMEKDFTKVSHRKKKAPAKKNTKTMNVTSKAKPKKKPKTKATRNIFESLVEVMELDKKEEAALAVEFESFPPYPSDQTTTQKEKTKPWPTLYQYS